MKDFSKYKLDVHKSPEDRRDWMIESVYPKEVMFPDKLDYRDELQPIRDQGWQGSCVAQVGACMKEWQEYHDMKFNEHMSPQFIYNLRGHDDSGMFARTLMKILYDIGSVPEYKYPYETNAAITEELKHIASGFRIKGYAQVNTIDGLKSALSKSGPCYIAVPVYHYEGQIWKPLPNLTELLGAHAMTIVGYDDKGFIIRNSWGEDWGDNGYVIFPYEHWGMQWEVWSTVDITDSSDDNISKWDSFWYHTWKWIKDKKGTLIYWIIIAIFLGYVVIDKFL